MQKRRAVFLDRDGTLIRAVPHPGFQRATAPFSFDELEFMPGAVEAVRTFRYLKLLPIMITNQPDVAYGYLTETEWKLIQSRVVEKLQLDHVFMCRHRRQDNCRCKKPSPHLILHAACQLDIDLAASYMVGDTLADMQAGGEAGCTTVLVDPSNRDAEVQADVVVSGIFDAAHFIENDVLRT